MSKISATSLSLVFLVAGYSSTAEASKTPIWEYGTVTFSEMIAPGTNGTFSYTVNWDTSKGRAFHCQEHADKENFIDWRLACAKQMASALRPTMETAVPIDAVDYEPVMLGFLGAMGWEIYSTRVQTGGVAGVSVTDYIYYLKRLQNE